MKMRLQPLGITTVLLGMMVLLGACSTAVEGVGNPIDDDAGSSSDAAASEEAAPRGAAPKGAAADQDLPKATSLPALPDLGEAPAWQNETWINSEEPLRLQDLRGKVILLEFWTFG